MICVSVEFFSFVIGVIVSLIDGDIQYVAQVQGTTQDHLQIFNIELKTKMKSHQMPEQVMILPLFTEKFVQYDSNLSV